MHNSISITQMARAAQKLKSKGEHFTLLGIGPMSRLLIESVVELANEKDFPILLIASRNQIDADKFGGGYVCGFDQKRFMNTVQTVCKKVGFHGLCYLCRDHGGPWQRDEERTGKLPVEEAMRIAKDSYIEDLKNGFDLLHIDPTKDPFIQGTVPLDLVLDRTVELIDYIEGERKRLHLPETAYEVGTEETNGGLTSIEMFENFVKELTIRLRAKGLPLPVFIVGQTGTLTRLTENVGQYNTQEAQRLTKVSNNYGIGLKEHNGDYLSNPILLEHPIINLDAMNVAPEFGMVETMSYIELVAIEQKFVPEKKWSQLLEIMTEYAVKGQRWRKWMIGETRDYSVETMLKDKENSKKILEICGHYTLDEEMVKRAVGKLKENLTFLGLNAEEYSKKKIKDSIDRYIYCFNQYGLTEKLVRAAEEK